MSGNGKALERSMSEMGKTDDGANPASARGGWLWVLLSRCLEESLCVFSERTICVVLCGELYWPRC